MMTVFLKSMVRPLLVSSGNAVSVDQARKVHEFWTHFNALLGTYKPRKTSINLDHLEFPPVDLSTLDNIITEEEVKAVILEMHPEKAPGPDGFTGLFYRLAWEIIKPEIMAAMQQIGRAHV